VKREKEEKKKKKKNSTRKNREKRGRKGAFTYNLSKEKGRHCVYTKKHGGSPLLGKEGIYVLFFLGGRERDPGDRERPVSVLRGMGNMR